MSSCHLNYITEAFFLLLLVIFQRQLLGFLVWWGPVKGLLEAAMLCYAPTIHHCNHTVIQMEWEICLPESKLCRWEEEMTIDLFPLGHVGVALDRIEKNMRELREEVCSSLKSGWHDGGYDYCSLLCQDPVDDTVIAREVGHSWSPPLRISSFCGQSYVYTSLPLDPLINHLWHDTGSAFRCLVKIWLVVLVS